MITKLHINISQGVIDIEGEPEFVREIYADFRDQLLNWGEYAPSKQATGLEEKLTANGDGDAPSRPRIKRRTSSKKKASGGDDTGIGVIADSPKLDKNLDTSNLPAFYQQYELKNNSEKILVFIKFLVDVLGIESPNTDQIYTCFEKVNERVPKIFSQAFRDASGRRFGYIDYNSPLDVRLTTTGNNYFKFDIKKKAAE